MKSISQFLFELERLLAFPKRQALVIALLACGLFALACLPLLFEPEPVAYSDSERRVFAQEVDAFYAQLVRDSAVMQKRRVRKVKQKWAEQYDSLSLFAFDPNVASEEEFGALGLSDKLIKTILNYRQKGGRFREKSDFKKMYGLGEEQFSHLEPYIVFGGSVGGLSLEQRRLVAAKPVVELFDFDPNTIDELGLSRLGFSSKQVLSILNFRASGVVFRRPSDFKKCYAVSDSLFERLAPFIRIDVGLGNNLEELLVELNEATHDDLVSIKGIGDYYAKLILQYRERLGGFISAKQLFEIKKLRLNDSLSVLARLRVDTLKIIPLRINDATLQELKKHPYIDYAVALAIVQRRESIGFFTNISELRDEKLITQNRFERLRPYLNLGK